MNTKTLTIAWIFIGISCIGGMCSKNGDNNNAGDSSGYTEPNLSPDSTWLYMTSDLPLFYANNTTRPSTRKWIATRITSAQVVPNGSDTTIAYMGFIFENTNKDTRFISDDLNPGGKETVEIDLNKFSPKPGTGTYTMDIDYKQGFCWFNIYKANGDKFDSTRHQGLDNSTLNITKMTVLASGGGITTCRMSGNISFEVMYFPTGASSTSNVHTMACTFNNVLIVYPSH